MSHVCILTEPRSFASPFSVHPAMTASILNPFMSNVSLKLPWCLAMAMAQEQQPPWVQNQLTVNSHNIQLQVYILEVQVLPLLAVIIIILLIVEPFFFTSPCGSWLYRVAQTCMPSVTLWDAETWRWQLYLKFLLPANVWVHRESESDLKKLQSRHRSSVLLLFVFCNLCTLLINKIANRDIKLLVLFNCIPIIVVSN